MHEEISVLLEKATEKIKSGRDTLNMINSSEKAQRVFHLDRLIDGLNVIIGDLDTYAIDLEEHISN